ncbi:MAG: hypothetical protein DRP83_07715 [Planctomycetota bacterium]|nr:MAG: hypothetical protein DRP83_07715 [Planctomycetota bacterium]
MARRSSKVIPKLTPARRKARLAGRRAIMPLAMGCVVAMLVLADRGGILGKRNLSDLSRYDGQTALVVYVVDGDTFDVDIPDGKASPQTRIRLWGVDTPETLKEYCPVQYFGPQASLFARQQLLGKKVRLKLLPHITRGKYGRVLAYVYLPDGRLFNREIILRGLGYADSRFDHPHKRDFADAMTQARKNRQGLWKHPKPKDWPYYLRKIEK